jgi:hypothetical protein
MAVVLWLAAVGLLTFSALLEPRQADLWLRVVTVGVASLGPLLLVLAIIYSLRRRLVRKVRQQLVDLAGPAIIRSMPPRTVLSSLLPWVYGDRTNHQDVLTGVLGGAGRDPLGRDTAVSRSTMALFRLISIDRRMCRSEAVWTHQFSGVRNSHKFVIFATCDREISTFVTGDRVFPLFELWVLDDEDQLEEFVPNLRDSLQIGVTYFDSENNLHKIEPRQPYGEEVALRHYDQFVRLPDSVDRKDLRIVQFDLYDLADADHVVESIESLSFKASAFFPADLGFFTWTPPHPCFVHRVTFDVQDLAREGEELVYLVLPSTMRKHAFPQTRGWVQVDGRIELTLDSWMLPGHGVTLLWRPLDESEQYESARWP